MPVWPVSASDKAQLGRFGGVKRKADGWAGAGSRSQDLGTCLALSRDISHVSHMYHVKDGNRLSCYGAVAVVYLLDCPNCAEDIETVGSTFSKIRTLSYRSLPLFIPRFWVVPNNIPVAEEI
jgi:hypothetical protein